MCGIAGQVLFKSHAGNQGPNIAWINQVGIIQRHRGPDESNIWLGENVALAHQRLSIIDLSSAASQPMIDKVTGVVLLFNGEIYNYLEIKDELISKGHHFNSHSDTEVLMRAYQEYNEDVCKYLNGMFAFAIWDPRAKQLFCARDRAGQKPFFYFHSSKGLIFSSELNSLLAHPDIPKKIDLDSLSNYLNLGVYGGQQSAIKDIKKLPQGSALKYVLATNKVSVRQYWSFHKAKQDTHVSLQDINSQVNFLEEVLLDAIKRNVRSDVPLGIYLSGGIDSTLLISLMSSISNFELNTFTVRHSDKSYNEANIAQKTANALKSNHHEMVLDERVLMETINELLLKIDEPISDLGLIGISAVAGFAKKHVKVVISGDGGDELFYGYEPFLKWAFAEKIDLIPPIFIKIARGIINKMPAQYGYMGIFYKADIFLSAYRKPKHLKNRYWAGVFTPNEISELLISPDSQLHERIGPLKKNSDDQSIDDLGLEYQTSYLPDVICAHTDKASMLHSIEARSPFLDNAVIDVALKIPAKYKLYQGFGKYILRKLLHKRLPQSKVPWLKKHGYTVPMASILRTDLKAYMLEALSSASLNNIGIFRSEPIELLINDHISGKRNNHKKLWTLIVFVTWYRNNIIINKS